MAPRPTLRSIPLADAIDAISGKRKARAMTMAIGQWDAVLDSAYAMGFVLVELNEREEPVNAYQKGLSVA